MMAWQRKCVCFKNNMFVCTCMRTRVHACVRARCVRVLLDVILKQATNMEPLKTHLATGSC
jgi:hypothetical protein